MSGRLAITVGEFGDRFRRLQATVASEGLDAFVVSSFDSICYLTGKGYEPLERPFFLIVRPDQEPTLLVPKLEQRHLAGAFNVKEENIKTYWDCPAPVGRGWAEKLCELVGGYGDIAVEPTLPLECALTLSDSLPRVLPLVERMKMVKSEAEVELIRRAARYANFGLERLLCASSHGASVAEGFAESRTVVSRIIREVDGWQLLTSKVVMAPWAAPQSAQPHSIPALTDKLKDGPHVALVLTRVNGYAAECERTYFTHPASRDMQHVFEALLEARRLGLGMVRPGVSCRFSILEDIHFNTSIRTG